MYIGDMNLNHKKDIFADGVALNPKHGLPDLLLEWP
jgi:hypothetical protein